MELTAWVFWTLLISTGIYIGLEILWAVVLVSSAVRMVPDTSPSISILVAARNEESQILRLLQCMDQLDYPKDRIQILIGQDRSEDRTEQVILGFIQGRPQFRMIPIMEDLPGLRGKQNVLAQLARQATGDIFLVTDADIEVLPGWAGGMAGMFKSGAGMVSAVTLAVPAGIFGGLQSVDWAVGMGVNGAMSSLGLPMTAVGNNMGVRRASYEQSGGYETMPFSVTEDLLLFREMVLKGRHTFSWSMDRSTVNYTRPVPDLRTWLRQRRRWFTGGADLPWYGKLVLGVYYVHLPVMLAGFFFLPWQYPAMAWMGRVCGDGLLLAAIGYRTGDLRPLCWLLPYQAWSLLQTVLLPLNQVWPGGVVWKGRKVG